MRFPGRKLVKENQHKKQNKNNNTQHFSKQIPDLEAFSRNPTDGIFAALAFHLKTFTKYLNKVFISYLFRLL